MIISVIVMLLSAGAVSNFVNRHPSMKILALSFLLLIGVMLVAEGFGEHVNKGYIYFAMGFSVLVELLNMQFRKHQKPVTLHSGMAGEDPTKAG
jgi:predicted tellurium resistance membrane protein TerC